MKKEEFDEIIYKKAIDYSYEIIQDPEDHLDAIEGVISDFIEGARFAWDVLKPNYND